MKPFTEECRYDYPLTPDSLVVDVGAYKGEFTRKITGLYDCRVIGFEPIREFWEQAVKDQTPKVHIHQCALGAQDGTAEFFVRNDSSGRFNESEKTEMVKVMSVDYLHLLGPIDLLKLNCEGGEFEILDAMLSRGYQIGMKNIQVQFHAVVPDAERRMKNIQSDLAETHFLTYSEPWKWESWQLR